MDSCKIEILALFFLVKYVFEYKGGGSKKNLCTEEECSCLDRLHGRGHSLTGLRDFYGK